MTQHATVPIPRRKPRPPWYARLSVMRLVVGFLALAVLIEGLVLLRQQQQLQRLVGRLDDARTLHELGLGEHPGALLLLGSGDADFELNDLRQLQADVEAWRLGFVARHQVSPEQAEMLAGVLSSHVSAYGGARVRSSLGSAGPHDRQQLSHGLLHRCERTATLLLGEPLGAAFAQEFGPAWVGWVGG